MKNIGILSTASYLPPGVMDVDDFLKAGVARALIDKWGIYARRKAGDETATDLEAKAGLLALRHACLGIKDVDLIIGAASVAEKMVPPNINLTQHKMGASHSTCLQVDLACAGALPAMMMAHAFLSCGQYRRALLVASMCPRHVRDDTDPLTCVTLGNGAAAVVVGEVEEGAGFIDFDIRSDGRFWNNVGVEPRAPYNPDLAADLAVRNYFYVDEGSQFSGFSRYALASVPQSARRLLKKNGFSPADVDWVVCHQNFKHVCETWIEMAELPREKVIFTYHKYGNLGAANVWTNLEEGAAAGKFRPGDLILFMVQGAGLSAGSALMRWSERANQVPRADNERIDLRGAAPMPVEEADAAL